jgi:alanine racemase
MHNPVNSDTPSGLGSSRRCWTELDGDALRENVRLAQEICKSEKFKVMAIVKANAYGHGAIRVSQALQGYVHSFGVACVGEAEVLRGVGIKESIYLLGPVLPDERARAASQQFIPGLSTIEEAIAWNALGAAMGQSIRVYWVIDTGMGRIGTLPSEVAAWLPRWSQWSHLKLDSVASHYPSADEDEIFTESQTQRFRELLQQIQQGGIYIPQVHIANSAGILGYERDCNEIVRAGLMLYGVSPFASAQPLLRPVLQWKSRITQVRTLPEGWGVNYGRSFITTRPTRTATIAAGYADGYLRCLGNRGANVLIHGQRCPLLGRITMDQIVADVTNLSNLPAVGDEVVLLGQQGVEMISAGELAGLAGTIPWEIFTSIRAS